MVKTSASGMTEFHWQEAKILIIDDHQENVRLLERVLEIVGILDCKGITDSREAMQAFRDFEPDLILLDLSMPHLNGFQILELLTAAIPADSYLPILILTADATEPTKRQALSSGARDFITKPFNNAEVILRVKNLLETRRLHLQLREHNESLEAAVSQRTIELEKAVADLQAAQQHTIQQERLRALGTMASGVAHDFNNSLSIIVGFGEFVLRDCERYDVMKNAAEQMRMVLIAAEDASKIVNRLKEFNRPEDGELRQSVDLAGLVEKALRLTKPRWETQAMGRGITIRPRLELARTPVIDGDPSELRELMTNLIFNAVDAMPEGGILTCRTRLEGELILLQVSDTGIGMSEEVRQRCLEPFFTTKGEGGTGLGLAMVYGIVQRHRGTMDIQSVPGGGTTFSFRFPAGAPTAPGAESVDIGVEQSLRILVVDDQKVIREILVEYLSADLHVVETASNGAEALAQLDANVYDIVITDQAMPGMAGDQLAATLKKKAPQTRTILLTGFGASEGEPMREGIDLVIAKPVSQRTLRRALSKVMRTGSA
ncbi:MAG: protein of unknown function, putative Histidine kinase [Chthoniobacter sp.]|nr:protein of unknown function, putative Histidine kinase [Chthoniobacter sp.]